MRKIIETIYFWTAMHMPMWFGWQYQFSMNARAYFEVHQLPEFHGWPWRWHVALTEER